MYYFKTVVDGRRVYLEEKDYNSGVEISNESANGEGTLEVHAEENKEGWSYVSSFFMI